MTHDVDVLVVGAGVSGIGAAYRLQTECPDHSYAVLEGRDAVGGTWDLFRYPGVRSDSDVYTFCYPFRPWDGEQTLADGESIRRYLEQVAAENGIDRQIRFGTRVRHAAWSSATGRWTVTAERGGLVETWSCRFLYACSGYYDYTGGYTPHFPGAADFTGEVVHPQSWPEGLTTRGRRVVVIGSGATAMTLVPALARDGAHVTMLQRTPTWVVSQRQNDPLTQRIKRRLPPKLAHRLIRARHLAITQGFYQLTRRRPDLARSYLSKPVVGRMGAAYAAEHFTPSYDPWDQRLCVIPDSDLLKAVVRGEVEVVTDRIDRLVPDGIRLASGRVLAADLIVTATGLVMKLLSGFDLEVDGVPVVLPERAVYRGLMLDGVPNFAVAIGYVNASWTLRADLSSRYVCRYLRYLDRHALAFGHPVRPPGLEEKPVMPLSSGYVQRAANLPVQGSTDPWTVPQNYLLDTLRMRRARIGADMAFEVAP
ncbi:flavin-containing monooxygenase [uncultured Friedmanniella sp.]|uniref:flavin-containing monooxygenase n=1 Tax=uncultured Friedmanniella sp. TaxID=335381 RepID=UPI0035C96E32